MLSAKKEDYQMRDEQSNLAPISEHCSGFRKF